MHASDARSHGETELRLFMLDAWRESSLYTDREGAALACTESLTMVANTGATDEEYASVKKHSPERARQPDRHDRRAINLWNGLQIAARAVHPVNAAATSSARRTGPKVREGMAHEQFS
jgi:alkylhydroperoxidase family enzyme